MTSEAENPQEESGDTPSEQDSEKQPPANQQSITQEIRHSQVSALVPELIGRGVFSTGAIVLQGPQEFILDFIVRIAQPHQVAARVVLAPGIMQRYITALQENIKRYQSSFGPLPSFPTPPPPPKPPSIEEIYDNLKLPEDVQSGSYANAVMISHTPGEFCFDFITNFYPKSAVAARIYLSAAQAPRLLDSLTRSFHQFQQKAAPQQPSPQPPEDGPPPGSGTTDVSPNPEP